MSLGVLGGTFDPIHLGHLRAAENARAALGLERVLLVPAGRPPHRAAPATAAFDRYTMTCLAAAGHPAFEPSSLEIERPGPSFTVDTLAALAARHPGQELFLVLGADRFADLATWHEADRLAGLCSFAVVERPGSPPAGVSVPGVRAVHVTGLGLEVSATAVRECARSGRSVRYLVPDAVADYITKRGLYR